MCDCCSLPVNVENEWNEIRKILIHQEKRIKELKNENRDFHADMAKMKKENRDLRGMAKKATEIEQLKADNHISEFGEKHSASQKQVLQIRNKRTNMKTEIRNA